MSHLVIESSPGVWGVAGQGGGLFAIDKMHCGILSQEASGRDRHTRVTAESKCVMCVHTNVYIDTC